VVTVSAVVVVIAAAGCAVLVHRRSHRVEDERLRRIVSSVPVPGGLYRSDQYFNGGGCRLAWSCERRTATVVLDGPTGVECTDVSALAAAWPGYRPDAPAGDCAQGGHVDGRDVYIEALSLDETAHLSLRVTIAGSANR
jgi:hypothetical protein